MSSQEPSQETSLEGRLQALYPEPQRRALEGLYLSDDLRRCAASDCVYLYSNFITSLDGRIAVSREAGDELAVPEETANPRDWRLLLELAAPADALIVSGRYLRQLEEGSAQALPPFEGEVPADILAFRSSLGLSPQPALVVISNSLELPQAQLSRQQDRSMIVVTSEASPQARARRLRADGVIVVRAGKSRVEGEALVAALRQLKLHLVYSIAGPEVMHTLLEAGVLQRLYLTTVLRVLSGTGYATMARGALLDPACDFELAALYLDNQGPEGIQQLLQVFDRRM
jgi:riboflavin biosynthesis pyrimidine reductase